MNFHLVLFRLLFFYLNKHIYFIADRRELEHLTSSNLDKRKSNKNSINNDDTDEEIDRLAQLDVDPASKELWTANNAVVQAERLQANGFETDIEQKQRRNDVLFLGKFLLI